MAKGDVYTCEARKCGKTFIQGRHWRRFCPPKKGEKFSACQESSYYKYRTTNRNVELDKYGTKAIREEIFVEPKYHVKCMKCGCTFNGNKYIRTCGACHIYLENTTRLYQTRIYKLRKGTKKGSND
jgi:hypothetical protein|tara:strand:- start:260 stop:637 length:378 start_codon:yes stop_codon:yes gene_type:complete